MLVDLVGWASTLILIATISRQVYTQWRTRSIAGVSKWLFIGQISASVGFTVYSYLVGNTVFVLTNAFLLVTAIVGECIYLRNKRLAERTKAAER
jgi:uncharacterized protein with PQ loop repeat